MALPTIHGTGRLTADPELRFAKSGTAVATIPLAFNARRYDRDKGEWIDGDVCFLRGTIFGDPAEHASQTYSRGTEVVIIGRAKTDQWQDRNTGENRSATGLLIDSIGPSTRAAKAEVVKTNLREPSDTGSSWPEVSGPPSPAATGATAEPPF